jgi:hypothetical protein
MLEEAWLQEQWAMKLFTGWMMSAGLALVATAANAQAPAPNQGGGSRYAVVSDFEGPYERMPQVPPRYGYGPSLLPATEVYTVLRENGFSPLGIPHQRGFVYTIAVIDRHGNDGQLVIDARDGRIIRFMPADRMGELNGDFRGSYGPNGPLPPVGPMRGEPRPPASVPHLASRAPTVPVPKPAPPRVIEAKPLAARPAPEPAQQSAAVDAKPVDVPAQAAAPAPAGTTPAAPQILPTQQMPKVQGLE